MKGSMKIAVFDCPMGIAGDMTVAACLDAGMSFELLKKELKKLNLSGYRLSSGNTKCGAFRAKKFSVQLNRHSKHPHTSLKGIEQRIRRSTLHPKIKNRSVQIFRKLGRAEARVHGIPVQKVHFHEVGAVDSIIDIVGAAICFHHLKIKKAYVRNITVGWGIQKGSHGEMPVPVPGTYELLKGYSLTQSDHGKEMITPTGAAILSTLCKPTDKIPRVKFRSIGYGAGNRKFNGLNGFVRVGIGDSEI